MPTASASTTTTTFRLGLCHGSCVLCLTPSCVAFHLTAVIPPGHYFTAAGSSGVVAKCPNGDADNPNGLYQPEWVQYNGAATTCTACGAGILSDDKEPLSIYDVSDDGSGAPTAKLVPKTDQSCCKCTNNPAHHAVSRSCMLL